MKKTFAVIGLGRFGLGLVQELSEMNYDVIALDIDKDAVEKASKFVSYAVITDSTNEDNLKELGLKNVNHAIIAIGNNIEATILTLVILKEMGIKKISVRLDNEYYTNTMLKLGADEIIFPEKSSGMRYARKIISDSFLDFFDISKEYAVIQIKINPNFEDKKIIDLDSRNNFNVNIVLIKRDQKSFLPKGSDMIKANDEIYVIGTNQSIIKFDQFLNK